MDNEQFIVKEPSLEQEYLITEEEFVEAGDTQEEVVKIADSYEDFSDGSVDADSKFIKILKFIFVKDIEIKAVALGLAGLLWILIAGLG
ncbi:MAG: hypothetical protein FWE13_04815 [Firmicutes bacterium]|nr:hypothetical protein [Bacillota bacterium]